MRSIVHMRGSISGRPAGRTNNSSLVVSNLAAKSRAPVYLTPLVLAGKATRRASLAIAARQTMEDLPPRSAVLRTSIATVGAIRRGNDRIVRSRTERNSSSNSREALEQ